MSTRFRCVRVLFIWSCMFAAICGSALRVFAEILRFCFTAHQCSQQDQLKQQLALSAGHVKTPLCRAPL